MTPLAMVAASPSMIHSIDVIYQVGECLRPLRYLTVQTGVCFPPFAIGVIVYGALDDRQISNVAKIRPEEGPSFDRVLASRLMPSSRVPKCYARLPTLFTVIRDCVKTHLLS
uniref:Uncharacterized protein n=1 Tax=Panagrellus redivivus TaxID=6233 RepID=A0A7E4VYW5_PANRE